MTSYLRTALDQRSSLRQIMEPLYHDGQIVWMQRCERFRPGEVRIFFFLCEERIMAIELNCGIRFLADSRRASILLFW